MAVATTGSSEMQETKGQSTLITGQEQLQNLPHGTQLASSLLEAGGGSIQDASVGRARLDILWWFRFVPRPEVDIYTPVMNQIAAQIQTEM